MSAHDPDQAPLGGARRLDADAAAAVFRRAAELERHGPPGGLDERAVLEAGSEVGYSPEVMRRAIAEYRAGLLGDGGRTLVGPHAARAARELPCTPAVAAERTSRVFARRRYRRLRDTEGLQVWVPGTGVLDSVREVFDKAWIRGVQRIEVRIVGTGRGTEVILVAERQGLRRGLLAARLSGAAVGGGGAAACALAAVVTGEPAALLGIPALGAAGGAAWVGTGAAYRQRLDAVREALEGLIDEVERAG